ncbi:MAG: cupin domain-containing protein [Gemmatimonadetes bacterium]|nr:cupin domain-containing protein [Gemmatimonadota bacterium]
MSSINRPLGGPVLTFDLEALLGELRAEESYGRSGRAGRTLARSGRMRVTLVAMSTDNVIGTHQADSPMTLHVLQGHIRFRTGEGEHELHRGEVLFFGPGDAHDIRATEDSALLITLSAVGDDYMIDDAGAAGEGQLSGL